MQLAITLFVILNLMIASLTGGIELGGQAAIKDPNFSEGVINVNVTEITGETVIDRINMVRKEDIIDKVNIAEEVIQNAIVEEKFNIIDININRRYLYAEMVEDIKRLKEAYPGLIKAEAIGKSLDNRDIYLIKIGKGDLKSLILGGVHAREIAAMPLLIKMINEYAKHYYTSGTIDGFNVKELLDNVTLYIVPSVNPDGMEIAIQKEAAIRDDNLRAALRPIPGYYVQWKANARGVDINRNFPCQTWGKVVPGKKRSSEINTRPHAEFYGGPQPASEPETQAIVNLIENNDFKILFDIHSKGRAIFWFKEAQSQEFNDINYKIAQSVGRVSGYSILDKSLSGYGEGTDGTTTDFASERGIQCLTIETLPYSVQFPFSVETIVAEWNHVKNIGLVLAEETIKLSN